MDSIFSPWVIWFVVGVALAFVELAVPGFVIIFFGIGCWMVAAVLLLLPITLSQQVFLFIVASVLSIVFLRKWFMKIFKGMSSDGTENDYDDFPKGARVKVVAPISPEVNGRIQFRGTLWDAASDETIEADEIVEIIRYAGDSHQVFFVKKPITE